MFGGRVGDGHPPVVGRAIGVAGRAGREAVAHPAGDGAELVVAERRGLHEPGQGLDQVHVHQLAARAVDVTVVEGDHHRVGRGQGRHAVGQHERGKRGRAVGLPGQVGEAAHGLGQGPEAGTVALRATPPVPGHVQHHHVGVHGVHRVVVDAPALEGAGAVAHDEDVALVEQLVEQVLALVLAQVQGHAALVAADALPDQADAVSAIAPGAHRVAGTGLFHLDDLGSELTEGGADHRPRGQGGELDDPDPTERRRSAVNHGRPPRGGPHPGGHEAWRPCSGHGRGPAAAARARPFGSCPRTRRACGWRR